MLSTEYDLVGTLHATQRQTHWHSVFRHYFRRQHGLPGRICTIMCIGFRSIPLILHCYAYQQTYRDALRWQFKQLGEPCDIPYLYCVDNRLYANAPTPHPRVQVPSYQNWSFPMNLEPGSSSSLAEFIPVEYFPPHIPEHYGPPYVQEDTGYRGPTGCM